MPVIGQMRFILAGGPHPLYANRPIYGHRREYLPLVRRTMFQVLVMFLGTPTWINVDENEVNLE